VHSAESVLPDASVRRQPQPTEFGVHAHLRHEQRCPSDGQPSGAQQSVSGYASRLQATAFGCALTSQLQVLPEPSTGWLQRVTVAAA
jgi:hypothetical protein